MKTAVITVKTKPEIKKQAKKVAENLGFNLSTLLNAYLHNLIHNRAVHFEDTGNKPSKRLLKSIKEAEENRQNGQVSPAFTDMDEAITWLEDPDSKYVSDL